MNNNQEGLHPTALKALRARVRGDVVTPDQANYVAARQVWNGAIDRLPSAIIVCSDAEDVSMALKVATDHRLQLTVRGGGHNVAGRSIQNGTLLLDLSRLRNVAVNSESRIASVQGGALWRDVDSATAAHGLATTGGLVSTTGVGGFTLGGGCGWLMRRFGLACDNLRSAGVVLGDGRFVRASADEHPDLYWGLRGGAGGLGVVTSFDFHLHPVREVLAGLVIHPAADAFGALCAFRDYAAAAPDDFCGLAAIANAPPLPFLDPQWHGRPVVIFALCWCGEVAGGEKALAKLRRYGQPVADHMGPMPYAHWQQLQDPGAPAGKFYYWKTANYRSLPDSTLRQLSEAAYQLPSARSEIHLQHMGGAVARTPTEDTAFAHREAQYFVNLIGIGDELSQLDGMRAKIRNLYKSMAPDMLPGTLINFTDQDDSDAGRNFGTANTARLAALKQRFDPAGRLASV